MLGPRCLRYRKQSAFLTLTACGAAVLCLYMSLTSQGPLVPPAATFSLASRDPPDPGIDPHGAPRGGGERGGGTSVATSTYHHRALQNSRVLESGEGWRDKLIKGTPPHGRSGPHPTGLETGGVGRAGWGVGKDAGESEGGIPLERTDQTWAGRLKGLVSRGGAAMRARSGRTGRSQQGAGSPPLSADPGSLDFETGGETLTPSPARTDLVHPVPERTVRLLEAASFPQTAPVPGSKVRDSHSDNEIEDSPTRNSHINTADRDNNNNINDDAKNDYNNNNEANSNARTVTGEGNSVVQPPDSDAAPGISAGVRPQDRRISSRPSNASLTSDTAIYVDEEGEGWRGEGGEGVEYPVDGPHSLRPLGGAVRRLPQALIIGVKKAGTRALLEFLRIHPDVRAPGPEPHFFDKHYQLGLDWYRKQMPPSLEGQLTIEKTPSYYVTREVPRRIFNMSKDVKLIVVVRDPVVRAISDYTQAASKRPDIPPFEQMAFINNNTRLVDTKWGAVRIGVYAKHLERWLRYFPLDQIHFVSGERLISDPAEEVGRVQDFLGLARLVTAQHFYLDETRGFPCIIKPGGSGRPHCLGKTKGRTHPQVPPDVLQRLRDFFRPFNLKFYQMAGQDFGWS